MKIVKVYGPGCKRCDAAETMIRESAKSLGVEVEIEKVSDPRAIAIAGVMSTPGISIDDKLVHAGGLPDPGKLEGWLAT
ncbi:thioredoxin family protein [Falsihalocynthiibacter arcticus]|uniref:Glutaredoxin n=1 Tax=Falsihalocynthiibacter arcticus TaxID=1579316 RepID=A0A126V4W6_9RHOB|nr:thioredoxin family protein [Falsihalocynthiibacter arcticus]AML53348.1 glutaredoxin [Falsihalocynthiibacter arcticus]